MAEALAVALTDDELFEELREVSARLNRRDVDLKRRAEIWEELRESRGFMLKPIAEASSGGLAKPLTEGAVTHGIKKLVAERAGTWDPKRTPAGKRGRRRQAQ